MLTPYQCALQSDCVPAFRELCPPASSPRLATALSTCMYTGAARCLAYVLSLAPELVNCQVGGVTPLECLLPFHHIRDTNLTCNVLRVLLDAGANVKVLERPGRGFDWWHPWWIQASFAHPAIYDAAYLLIDHGLAPGAADPRPLRAYYAATLRAKARRCRALYALVACLRGAGVPRVLWRSMAVYQARWDWKEWLYDDVK